MTKRHRLHRSEKPKPEQSKHDTRRRMPWSERHKGHTTRVHACPYCSPGAPPSPNPNQCPARPQSVDMTGI